MLPLPPLPPPSPYTDAPSALATARRRDESADEVDVLDGLWEFRKDIRRDGLAGE
jgi:hypothetical protein